MGNWPSQSVRLSFSQFGEDRIIETLMNTLFNKDYPWTYFEIGTNHPTERNNTYLAYIHGSHGVVVEPNPDFKNLIEQYRPMDTFYNAGISFDHRMEALYYNFANSNGLNTFDEEVGEAVLKKYPDIKLRQKVKLPLLDANDVIKKHFKRNGLDLLCVDAEGMDFNILKSIDFTICRPKIICVEVGNSLISSSGVSNNVNEYMESWNYALASTTFVNNIYVNYPSVQNHSFIPLEQNSIRQYILSSSQLEYCVFKNEQLLDILTGGISHIAIHH